MRAGKATAKAASYQTAHWSARVGPVVARIDKQGASCFMCGADCYRLVGRVKPRG